MTTKQKRAISYAIHERDERRREAFIIERDGSLELFNASPYKRMVWYIVNKWGVHI